MLNVCPYVLIRTLRLFLVWLGGNYYKTLAIKPLVSKLVRFWCLLILRAVEQLYSLDYSKGGHVHQILDVWQMFGLLIGFFTYPGLGLIPEPRRSSLEVLAIYTDSPITALGCP